MLSGPAMHNLVYGGARSGKTFLLCWAIATRAVKAAGSRHLIARFRFNHVKTSVLMDTWPKVMRLAYPDVPCEVNKTEGYATFWNGSEVWFGGLDDKDRTEKILGQEYTTVYANESSQIPYGSISILRTRLAQKVTDVNGKQLRLKAYYDLNPVGRSHWSYKLFHQHVDPDEGSAIDATNYAFDRINPKDNEANLPPETLRELASLPDRQRKRFWLGDYVDDVPGALWSSKIIGLARVTKAPELKRIVVSVDPAASDKPGSNEHGIVVVGIAGDNHAYVLADESLKGSPSDWAARVASVYREHGADAIVAEVNQGGDMVEHVIKTVLPNVVVRKVHASRGKYVRAEPFSALYEQGRVHHVGVHSELEEQMVTFTPERAADRADGYSPDRVDALVWGLKEIFPDVTGRETTTDANLARNLRAAMARVSL